MYRRHQKLKPLPRGLIEVYRLIAVLIVLIPEWLGEVGLSIVKSNEPENTLPKMSLSWERTPELRLATMNIYELRQLAKESKLLCYSSNNKAELYKRLIKRLAQKSQKDFQKRMERLNML